MICGKKPFISRWLSIWRTQSLVSKSPSQFPGLISGNKVSLVGLLRTVVVGVEAAGRVVLADLCTPLCWRFHQPGQEGGEESRVCTTVSAICAHFCADIALLCHLPQEVVMAVAVPSGQVVYMFPLWCDECVGSVWGHEQIWKSRKIY